MNRIVLGAVAALLFVSAGLFWWQGRAELERGAPPPDISGTGAPGEGPVELPSADPHGRGPGLPGGGKRVVSKAEVRFHRYDRNRDGQITRTEMLGTRVKSFQKLDVNHDNLLTFEEWAVKTANRFRDIDRNGDGMISRTELDGWYGAKDATKDAAKAGKTLLTRCSCQGEATAARRGKPAGSDDDGEPAD